MNLITIDMDALARAIYSNTDASEQEARSIINTVGFAAPAPASEAVAEQWRDMATAPKDGTLLRLLVNFEDHATEDGEGPLPTIGSNTWDNHHDFDEWQFAGRNWEHDCYTQGVGTPVGWLPMLAAPPPGDSVDAPVQQAGELMDEQITAIHSMPYVRGCLLEYVQRPRDEEASAIVKAIAAQIAALKGEQPADRKDGAA